MRPKNKKRNANKQTKQANRMSGGELDAAFELAAQCIQAYGTDLSQSDKLRIYGLFKQVVYVCVQTCDESKTLTLPVSNGFFFFFFFFVFSFCFASALPVGCLFIRPRLVIAMWPNQGSLI